MTSNIQQMHVDTILLDVSADNTKQVFEKLTSHISTLIGTPEQFLFNMLAQREKRQNSGIGRGVAVLDAQLPRLTRPIIFYMKLNKSIDYNAADGEPVDMITLVLSPEFEGTKHLQRLAMVTRFFRNSHARKMLRNASNYDDVRTAINTINEMKKVA